MTEIYHQPTDNTTTPNKRYTNSQNFPYISKIEKAELLVHIAHAMQALRLPVGARAHERMPRTPHPPVRRSEVERTTCLALAPGPGPGGETLQKKRMHKKGRVCEDLELQNFHFFLHTLKSLIVHVCENFPPSTCALKQMCTQLYHKIIKLSKYIGWRAVGAATPRDACSSYLLI